MWASVFIYTSNGLSVLAAAERVTQIVTLPTSSVISIVEFERITFTTTKNEKNIMMGPFIQLSVHSSGHFVLLSYMTGFVYAEISSHFKH